MFLCELAEPEDWKMPDTEPEFADKKRVPGLCGMLINLKHLN